MRTIRALCALVVVAAAAGAETFAAPAAHADPYEDLINMTPGDYSTDTCHPVYPTPNEGGVLISASCGALPSGQSAAFFVLHKTETAMLDTLQTTYNDPGFGPVPCPGAPSARPGTFPGGTIACGMGSGPAVMFSFNPRLLTGLVRGDSLESLFAFLQLSAA